MMQQKLLYGAHYPRGFIWGNKDFNKNLNCIIIMVHIIPGAPYGGNKGFNKNLNGAKNFITWCTSSQGLHMGVKNNF